MDYPSQVFFRTFEPFLQTLALQKWLNKNKDVTSLIFKLTDDLKIIDPLVVNAHLQISEIFDLLKQAKERLSNLINLLQPVNEDERSVGGSPVGAKTLLIGKLQEHQFFLNYKDYIQLTPRQIIYVLVGLGIWLPYTDPITNESVTLEDLVAHKLPSVRADIRRAKDPKRKVIQLKRIALRRVP